MQYTLNNHEADLQLISTLEINQLKIKIYVT